jgi:predicted secreted hydrolase
VHQEADESLDAWEDSHRARIDKVLAENGFETDPDGERTRAMNRATLDCTGDDRRLASGGVRSRWRRRGPRFGGVALVLCFAAAFFGTAQATTAPTVRPVVLPRDQGAHPGFGDEWWYTTGTLTGANRRDYFWFATIWSAAGALVARVNVVDLGADRIVLSHEYVSATAVTDGQTQFTVGAFGLGLRSGGTLGRWSVDAPTGAGGRLQLDLVPRQPYVLHGHRGIIQQGNGGPSAYYSAPRLAARGTLTLTGKPVRVTGRGWLDHQWGNFGASVGALKWDWFACQFQNGGDLMLYQFLNRANHPTGRQTGTLLTRVGVVKQLVRFTITPLGPSIRPAGATTSYPLAWRLQVPADKIDITIHARARNQFMTNQFVPNFWEAASEITSGTPGTCTVESSREVGAPPK